jgi:electron transfer flavoprotein alpha subunit
VKIAVCVKWVPVVARLRFDAATRRIVREGVPSEPNPNDVLAIQRAVELKAQTGATVDAYTMGPPSAREALTRALAMGVDNGYHLSDTAFAGSDTLATAHALAGALSRGGYDLVLMGAFSVDAETGQVGPQVAGLLNVALVTGASRLDVVDGAVRALRHHDDGDEEVEAPLPALVTVVEGVAPETFPGREAIAEAAELPVTVLSAADLDVYPGDLGSEGSPTWVGELRITESSRTPRILEEMSVEDAAREVAAALYERGLLDPAARASRRQRARVPAPRPAGGPAVWALAEVDLSGGLRPVSHELLAAASGVAEAVGGHTVGVLLGPAGVEAHAGALAAHGADAIAVGTAPALAGHGVAAAVEALAVAVEAERPHAVLLPSTPDGREVAALLAARLRLGLTGDAVGLEVDAQGLAMLKPAFGGNVVAPVYSRTLPNLVTVRPGIAEAFAPAAGRAAPQRALAVPEPVGPQTRRIGVTPSGEDAADLDAAWCVIGVGKGVGGPEGIAALEPLRALLDARFVCTRDVVEAGWMPAQLQVGITGRSIAPELYIGIGVRGDFNHMVGVQRAGFTVGVNNNRRASLFRQVDLGVLADWAAFVPALLDSLA